MQKDKRLFLRIWKINWVSLSVSLEGEIGIDASAHDLDLDWFVQETGQAMIALQDRKSIQVYIRKTNSTGNGIRWERLTGISLSVA
jgi:hypothetical protein